MCIEKKYTKATLLKLEGKKQHFRHILLYNFRKEESAAETQKIHAMCGEDAINNQTFQKLFFVVSYWRFLVEHSPHLGS